MKREFIYIKQTQTSLLTIIDRSFEGKIRFISFIAKATILIVFYKAENKTDLKGQFELL